MTWQIVCQSRKRKTLLRLDLGSRTLNRALYTARKIHQLLGSSCVNRTRHATKRRPVVGSVAQFVTFTLAFGFPTSTARTAGTLGHQSSRGDLALVRCRGTPATGSSLFQAFPEGTWNGPSVSGMSFWRISVEAVHFIRNLRVRPFAWRMNRMRERKRFPLTALGSSRTLTRWIVSGTS